MSRFNPPPEFFQHALSNARGAAAGVELLVLLSDLFAQSWYCQSHAIMLLLNVGHALCAITI